MQSVFCGVSPALEARNYRELYHYPALKASQKVLEAAELSYGARGLDIMYEPLTTANLRAKVSAATLALLRGILGLSALFLRTAP